jgi:hypothetical protein
MHTRTRAVPTSRVNRGGGGTTLTMRGGTLTLDMLARAAVLWAPAARAASVRTLHASPLRAAAAAADSSGGSGGGSGGSCGFYTPVGRGKGCGTTECVPGISRSCSPAPTTPAATPVAKACWSCGSCVNHSECVFLACVCLCACSACARLCVCAPAGTAYVVTTSLGGSVCARASPPPPHPGAPCNCPLPHLLVAAHARWFCKKCDYIQPALEKEKNFFTLLQLCVRARQPAPARAHTP